MFETAKKMGRELRKKGLTISVAESCTGGLIQKLITDIPGSSTYFMGGVVVYSNELKEKIIGVRHKTLLKHGAVSEEVVSEMAKGVVKVTNSDIGISTTGIAGPDGASFGKPVGLVYIGVYAYGKTNTYKFLFKGSRKIVREQTAKKALQKVIGML